MTDFNSVDDLTAFLDLARRWQLTVDEQAQLLAVEPVALAHGSREPASAELSEETRSRLGCLLRIDALLHVLLPMPERADAWVRLPNAAPMFAGATALSYLLQGPLSALQAVADYLAGVCGGDFS